MKLFRVTTKVREYHGCKDVTFHWFFAGERPQRRPYAELIENYDPEEHGMGYPELLIDELFSEDEARQVKDYLDREHEHEGTTTVEEEGLPVPTNVMGFGAIAVGGGDDFYRLDREEGYSLPFKVLGYFNLVGHELVDGTDVFRHRLLLVGRNGARWQTNEEAGRGGDAKSIGLNGA